MNQLKLHWHLRRCQTELTAPDGGNNSQDFRKGTPQNVQCLVLRWGLSALRSSLGQHPGPGETPTTAPLLWGTTSLTPSRAPFKPSQISSGVQSGHIGPDWHRDLPCCPTAAALQTRWGGPAQGGWHCTPEALARLGSVTGHLLNSLDPHRAGGLATDHPPVRVVAPGLPAPASCSLQTLLSLFSTSLLLGCCT